jgi:lysophospholipase L1-like esterase
VQTDIPAKPAKPAKSATPAAPAMSRRKRIGLVITIVVLVLAVLEIASLFSVSLLQRRGAYYTPPPSDGYDRYLEYRDPVFGWPAADSIPGQNRDIAGSRVTPAFPDPSASRSHISLYGDSFTWSSEVGDEHAWGNVLSRLLDRRVANYGVGGYGTDQAYLRFLHNDDDEAEIVFLNHFTSDIMRNVTQFTYLVFAGARFAFKPRFILDENENLQLVPIPTFDPQEIPAVIRRPERYLPHEYFAPGGASGVRRARFPYILSALRSFRHFRIRAKLTGEPWYKEFYEKDHPSRGLQVTAAILAAFTRTAAARSKIPIVTILPSGEDLLYFQKTGTWTYQNLLDELAAANIDVVNVGSRMMQRLDGRDPRALFFSLHAHYNEEGYAMVALIAYEVLRERGLLP